MIQEQQSITPAEIRTNLEAIRADLAKQATAADRSPDSVQLLAVSKTKPLELIQAAVAAGQKDFGENRAQEMAEKYESLPDVHWHMIGHLQRNKVKYIAPFVHLVHSVDSPRLLREINKEGRKNERVIDILLQINISDEDQKSGMEEPEAAELMEQIAKYEHIRIRGLMGMAEFTDDTSVVRSQFQRLAEARDRFRRFEGDRISMEQLSMGMSGDYPVAIEEGSTMVRIGSAIFGSR